VIFCSAFVSIVYEADTKDLNAQSEKPVVCEKKAKGPLIDDADMSTTYGKTPFNKLTRGVLNMSTFYLEVPANVIRVGKEKNDYFIGATIGTAQGFFACMLRALTGVYDTVTFVIPPYNRPVMQPEYAVQSIEEAQK
jgi:putative exosortase-associated protein (TIGR04073 family)